ncbi:hypothetical protein PDIG_29100 [Penicillium digitatum PHI26]|uniref:Uncharacterized protein n=2 Tax=Penicillium digitatum TaxID=36651 RepID=K9G0Y3_PEND2|nr:hypothetical protein PDIP_63520 [Penicillium digitatum Pd1]EKV09672.1 hypothetical protein PDIP_63520 [Penicillium digitatum Pd1]EKV15034.1 hypothetical protein PDIG_29100 [Penicillium digitatum PHI26]
MSSRMKSFRATRHRRIRGSQNDWGFPARRCRSTNCDSHRLNPYTHKGVHIASE